MKAASIPVPQTRAHRSTAILWGGLVAGSMDITAAIVIYGLMRGTTAARILQSVASGWLGMASYDGGLQTAALGLFFQYLIATTAAAVYFVITRFLPILVRYYLLCGPLYGIVVYFFMSRVVVPLSAYPHRGTPTLQSMMIGITIHIFCVGLPIAITNRWLANSRD